MATDVPALARRLGLGDAVAIGLGSMLGAGVFAAFAPAARAAGAALLIGLLLAGVVAWCNATSSGQLAAQFPESGGTYVYGRRMLGHWPGFLAGWSFVVGKTASCAAMALTVGAYVAPEAWGKAIGVLAIAAVTAVGSVGVHRTAAATRITVYAVIAVLALVVVAAVASGGGENGAGIGSLAGTSPYGVLQSAGILFFAFAGYARIATMGEEVRDPRRTIPRAIIIALSLVLAIYLVIAVVSLVTLGPEALASSRAPLADVATAGGWEWTAAFVRVGAAWAALGALLALSTGVSRTILAMARERDLPAPLARIHAGHQVPRTATIAVGVVVVALVLLTDLRTAIGFSSFGVLLYYLIANVAALRQDPSNRRYPRAMQVGGIAGCVVLAATLPVHSILIAVGLVALGVAYRAIRRYRELRAAAPQSP